MSMDSMNWSVGMRELKFRAGWQHDKYNPEGSMFGVAAVDWSTPDEGEPERELHDNPIEVGLVDYPYKTGTYQKIGWNKDCKLMQYTGLKDKNGVEIYEGDILRVLNAKGIVEVGYVEYRSDMASFVISTRLDERAEYMAISDHISFGHWFEVIGNIYENPDLLESK